MFLQHTASSCGKVEHTLNIVSACGFNKLFVLFVSFIKL